MVYRRALLIGLAVCLAMGLASCGEKYSYRYRVTAEVVDHGRVRYGTVVHAQTISAPMRGLSQISQPVWRTKAEAIAIPLQSGEVVVVTLRAFRPLGPLCQKLALSPACSRLRIFPPWEKGSNPGLAKLARLRQSGVVQLDRAEFPGVVAFADAKDPTTIRLIDPAADIAPNVELKTVTVQVTTDRETDTIRTYLPWLARGAEVVRMSRVPTGKTEIFTTPPRPIDFRIGFEK